LTFVVDATTLFALGFDDAHAMDWRGTFDARAVAVANIDVTRHARRSCAHAGRARNSRLTEIRGAWIVIVKHVGIVVDGGIHPFDANVELAVSDDFVEIRRWQSIDGRVDAGPCRRITQIACTRIAVVAIGVRRARNHARARFARPRGFPLRAHRIVG
jgi:hypothetical protein